MVRASNHYGADAIASNPIVSIKKKTFMTVIYEKIIYVKLCYRHTFYVYVIGYFLDFFFFVAIFISAFLRLTTVQTKY
jgi:hypothetical protein